MASRWTIWGFFIAFFALIAEVSLQRVVPSFYSSQLLQAPKGHYVELNFTLETSYPTPCIDDMYLAIRDGYNKSANLLGRFCGRNISGIVRSSGQNLWIRKLGFFKHYIMFWGSYTNKTLNITVYPNLDNVVTTQFVLFNQTSSLWCPALGAPAPIIVWRKNGTVVQNSTSVQYQLNITGENYDKYSCEVNRRENKEIHLVIESCPHPCKCTRAVGIMSAATLIECRGKYLQSVPRHLPLSTVKLWLRNNKIEKLRGDSFSQLVKLKRLDLGTNQIEELPPEVFHNNTELVKLWLDGNKIKKLSGDLLSQLIKLQWLDLQNNQIEELPPGVFNNNTELNHLKLDANQIEELPPGVFNGNTELTELWLNKNQIKKLRGDLFAHLVKLQWLNLGANQIEELPPGVFNKNTELTDLYLDKNQIEELPKGVFNNNTELTYLSLDNNRIKELHHTLLTQLTKLQKLRLHINNLEKLPKGLFDGLWNLTKLRLQDNAIQMLPKDIFKDLVNLDELDLSKNKVEKLPEGIFSKLTKLTKLDLSYNKVEKLPDGIFCNLTKLTALILSSNQIEDLPPMIFANLTKLRTLYMHYNKFRELPYGFFEVQKDIQRVSLDTNLICCHMHKEDADCTFIYNDDFANCESMFKSPTSRKSIWVVGSLSLVGSVFVISWRSIHGTNTAQSIMLLHLAVSDGLMGAYLITLAVKDLLWRGEYYLHDSKWRSGLACQITGATSLLSSEVSLMLMALISADRLKNIVFPFRGGALSLNMTHFFCAIIWLVGFLLAFFPMFGLRYFENSEAHHNYYGKSVVCLPLQLSRDKTKGWEYSVSVFIGLNFFLFMFITVAYLSIFISRVWVKNQSANTRRETGLAKRVFFIIFTDCLCWMPIIVFGLRSVLEENYKPPGGLAVWIAVFVLPINSAINPILYTLATPKVQEYLGGKVAKLKSFLRSTFKCSEEQEEQQQDPQEIEDNGPHKDEQKGEAMEMQFLGLLQPQQDEQDKQVQHGEDRVGTEEQFNLENQEGAELIEIRALSMPPQEQEDDHEGEENDLEYDTKL